MRQIIVRILLRKLPFSIAIAVGYSFIFQLLYNSMRYSVMWPYKSFGDFLNSYSLNFFPLWLSIMFVWVWIFNVAKGRKAYLKFTIDIVGTAVWVLMLNTLFSMAMGGRVEWAGTVFNMILIFTAVEALYYWKSLKKSIIQSSKYKEELLVNRYRTLKMQINPHFLFNSLNILIALIAVDTRRSREYVESLARLYRYIMSNEGNETVPLSEEIMFMNDYLYILNIRYLDKIKIEVSSGSPTPDASVVAYTLQLLLENIPKHNIVSSSHPMTVNINIETDRIIICNKLRKRQATTPSSGIGLKYLKEMYARYGLDFIYSESETDYTVVVPFIITKS